MTKPIINVVDIAFVRYRTTDLDKMEQFLVDFGMQRAERTEQALYMRGTEEHAYLYVTELAEQTAFVGPAFEVASHADLERIAAGIPGAGEVHSLQSPGGGHEVVVADPDGYKVAFVHGIEPAAALPVREPLVYNQGRRQPRKGDYQRPPRGPAHVRRIGHLVMRVSDLSASRAWYEQFGFVASDSTYDPEQPERTLNVFMRCNRGQEWTDHHTVGLAARQPLAVDHTAFECVDLDDIVLGGNHLAAQGYTRSWGVGRHIMGSQIFDYWRDPYGFKMEHFTDGDLLNIDSPSGHEAAGDDGPGAISQWGPITEDYLKVYPEAARIGDE